FILLFI
ncbi:hypothetical protein ACTFIW_000101, partial [Dictyostelium discoideum]